MMIIIILMKKNDEKPVRDHNLSSVDGFQDIHNHKHMMMVDESSTNDDDHFDEKI